MVTWPKIEKLKTELSYEKWMKTFTRKLGLVRIGYGAFANVYSKSRKSSRTVIKIGTCDENFKGDGYVGYLRNVVLKHQGNPWVPTIYSVRLIRLTATEKYFGDITTNHHYVYVVKMERLIKYGSIGSWERREKLMEKFGLSEPEEIARPHEVAKRDKTRTFKKIANAMHKLFRKFEEDLHEGNIMWRGRNNKTQLVITDPCV